MKLKIKRRITTSIELQDTHPILQRVYAARGIQSNHDLEYELKHLHPYISLLGIERAAEVLTEALVLQKNILIIGDFDADGATSSALAVSALKTLGAQYVEFLVPNRFEYGYGLTPEIVEVAVTLKPDLIITVDNGIASNAGVDAANQKGIQVLVTDHHL
ncbi:MAG: DHH family phosphoesterase, partial [Proteobacteria bacterium]|nr:DHH family phosphoesterase [Pseudomonadota bacterium]